MKLNAFDRKNAVTETHDQAFRRCRGDLEAVGKCFPFDDERVVTRCPESVRQVGENSLSVVADLDRFSVYGFGGTDDATTEYLADRLMTEADAENRDAFREVFQHIE